MPTKKRHKPAAPRKINSALRIHGSIARDLGIRIVSGRYQPGHVLAGEVEASERLNVSRTAYREAVRILAAKGLVRSRPRTGTRVSQPNEWHLLDPDVLAWAFSGDPEPEVLHGLFELREIIEPAAAALAANRRDRRQLEAMRRALEAMAQHTLNTEAGRLADKQFHAALLRATCNPFIISLTNSVTAAVQALTEFKIRGAALKRDPVPDHVRVYEAIAAKDAERARAEMSELIRLAILDTPMKQRPKHSASSRFLVD
ncbi:MAG: FadR/GntR family transcriptional regulator [Gammaproteobacteria bacterium]|nr:GntR family transcriptional regulator [Gammaproteobacteria bacterium]